MTRVAATVLAAAVVLGAIVAGYAKSGTLSAPRSRPAPDAPAVVAPVFEHGTGEYVTRGDGLWPVCFSEAEARLIIQEELGRRGIWLTPNTEAGGGIWMARPKRVKQYDWTCECWMSVVAPDTTGTCWQPFDLVGADQAIAIVFVSWEKATKHLGGLTIPVLSFAQHVSAEMAKKARGAYIGVFYEPLSDPVWDRGLDPGLRKMSFRDVSEKLLREQVRDFVDWLKAQGAI